jgi:hypothetical protein
MKRILPILVLFLTLSATAQQPQQRAPRKVTKANYGLAARFSQKRVRQMVYSTQVTPHWFANDDRFWYSYKTAQGTKFYLVDPASGRKSEIFDMDRLAMQVTEITRDPYDAQHLPINLVLKKDKYFQFDITTKTEKKDSTGKGRASSSPTGSTTTSPRKSSPGTRTSTTSPTPTGPMYPPTERRACT